MKPNKTVTQSDPSMEEIGRALSSLVNTATPLDRSRVLQEHIGRVLTDKAVEILNMNIQRASAARDAEALSLFQHVRSVIEMARSQGIDAAVASLLHEHHRRNLERFISSSSWAERKKLFEENAESLLSDGAEKILQDLLEFNATSPDAMGLLQAISALLTVARENGTEAAFIWLQNQILGSIAQSTSDRQHETAEFWIKELQNMTESDQWQELNSRVIDTVVQYAPHDDDSVWLFRLMCKELESAPTRINQAVLALKLGKTFVASDEEGVREESIKYLHSALEFLESNNIRVHGGYGTLAHGYMLRKNGDHESNLLLARDYLERELRTLNRPDDPQSWAVTQRLLGEVFRQLNQRSVAIEHFAASLEEEPEGVDQRYSETGLDLARLRIEEQGPARQAAIENAIENLHRAAVKAPPNSEVWARIHMVLGNTYRERKSGDPGKNSEQGFYHTNQALRVFTRRLYPNEWAQMQHNLGTLHYTDVRGDRSDNLEQAIRSYYLALGVHTKEAYPQFYGLTCSALGLALIERSAGIREENLEEALKLLKDAESILDPKESAMWLAECRNGIGMIYSERGAGNEHRNLLQAAEHMDLARQAYHDLGNKEREHVTFSNLAAIYTRLAEFDKNASQKSVRYAQLALEGADQATDPYYWAIYNRNLGAAIFNQEEPTQEDINRALDCLANALKIFTPDRYLAEYRVTQNSLGHAHFQNRSWELALQAYQAAIEAGERSLASSYTEPGRRSVVRDTELAHVRSSYCLIKLGRFNDALVAVESGKTRLLREALSRSEIFAASVPEELVQKLRTGQSAVRALEGHMRQAVSSRSLNVAGIGKRLLQARAELDEIAKQIRAYSPDFGEPIDRVSEIIDDIPENGALAAFAVTSDGGFVVVIEAGAKQVEQNHIVPLPSLTTKTLAKAENDWLRLIDAANTLSSADQFGSWLTAQRTSMNNLWKGLAEPIHTKLVELGVKQDSTLLILPQAGLWLVPLHAASRREGDEERALADNYTIIQTPSIYVRKLCVSRSKERADVKPTLVAVVNPTADLPFAAEEVSLIAPHFTAPILLDHTTATRQNVITESTRSSYLHFACHGQHNWSDPMMSELKLASRESLLLSSIFAELVIDSNRLVVLSACESGVTDLRGATEEFLGLPTGFLLAGATGVVSSLWKVEDAATSLLMSRLYRLHMADGDAPQNALRAAQRWLRNLTAQDLISLGAAGERLIGLYPEGMLSIDSTEKICDYPFFWGGFTFVGV